METVPVVQLVDVVAVLDRFPALAGVTLTVRRGEIVLLSGPNGAAAILGMKRTTLQSRMKKLGISRP